MQAYLLLWVVCRICKYPWKYSAIHSIIALDYDAIFIGINEIVVYQNTPDSMKQLPLAVCDNVIIVLLFQLANSSDKLCN